MNKYVQFFIMVCTITIPLPASEKNDRSLLTLPESIIVGGLTGAAEVTFPGQLLSYWMNRMIANEKFVLQNSYQGFCTHAGGLLPITAVVKMVEVQSKKYVEEYQQQPLSQLQTTGVSLFSGIAGGIVDTASNCVQLYQQNPDHTGKTVLQSCKELGLKGIFRGFTPNALKEAKFALAWLQLSEQGQQLASQYIPNKMSAKIIGGASVGVITAIITLPEVVIRNKMQADTLGKVYTNPLQTAQKIYAQEGIQALFKGIVPRSARLAIAIPLYGEYSKFFEKLIKNGD